MKPKLVLGLSGGVDSAVAARLLLEQGFQVSCVYLNNGVSDPGPARAAAGELGLPLDVIDIRPALEALVCRPFAEAYLAGRTPNPCVLCNPSVKFAALLAVADELHAPFVATGHYARVERSESRALLKKGMPANDQSYMLSRLPQSILQRVIFPLGDYEKSAVRELAAGFGLSVANKPDSMEICFIPGNDYAAWLEERGCALPEGDFVSPDGTVLGRHKGIHRYTLGQGKGLGVSGPHRYFVSKLDTKTNRITLSDGSDLGRRTIFCTDPSWIAVDGLTAPMEVTARFRHSRSETACVIHPAEDGVRVEAKTPVRAPTPGQLAVFYDGDTVLGSAWIA